MEITVVVPVRDGAGSLPALLASLAAQTLARERFEVIVVDNASRDDTAAIARAHGATVVHEPVPNRSRARNAGARAAATDLLAFTDADCVVAPGWLAAFLARADRSPLVAGPVEVTAGDPPTTVERFESLWRFGQEHWVRDGWAATANLLIERAAFEAVGGFDPGYRHIGEDVDLCLRAGRAGLALGWCPGAVVHHGADDRLWPLLKRSYRHGYGSHEVYDRLGAGYRAWRRPQALLGDGALALLGRRRGDLPEADRRPMLRLARASYGARMAGSLAADLRRLRG
jgi:GT2 family glycosyltransferase